MALFILHDSKGNVVAKDRKSFEHYKRSSMRGAAEQKFLDKLIAANPTAAEARIVKSYERADEDTVVLFRVSRGTSQFSMFCTSAKGFYS